MKQKTITEALIYTVKMLNLRNYLDFAMVGGEPKGRWGTSKTKKIKIQQH